MTKEQRDWITQEIPHLRAQSAQFKSNATMCEGAAQAYEQLLAKFPLEASAPAPSPDADRAG